MITPIDKEIKKKRYAGISNFNLKGHKFKNNSSYPDISATSVAEVTGIPRATCIRKLDWLCKAKFIKKDLENKRYFLFQDTANENFMNHPLASVKATIQRFSDLSLMVYKSLLK